MLSCRYVFFTIRDYSHQLFFFYSTRNYTLEDFTLF